jgi:hypothetical protein
LVQDRVQYNCCKKKIKSRKTFNIVENILSQILSHLTQTIPILQNLNQVTVLVTNYPVPSHSTKRAGPNKNTPIAPSPSKKEKKINKIQNRNQSKKTNQSNQVLRYIPSRPKQTLHAWAECGREFDALQPKTTNA